jgi:hypothetical protein
MSIASQALTPAQGKKINWYEAYILVNHWKSDLGFYREDITFLQQLIEKYLIWITKKENLERVADIRKKGHELAVAAETLHGKISDHLSLIVDILEERKYLSREEFLNLHGHLETELSEFVKDFRNKRKEVFKVTEYVMDSEELQNVFDT